MALEGYRQIVGDTAFFAFQKALATEYAYSTITGDQFKALARRIAAEKAGFEASNLAKLDEYWQQWISMPSKPTLTPTTFFQSTSVPGTVGGTVPATLSLTLGAPISFGAFTPGVARTYSASTTANVISTAGDATLSVVDPSTNNPGQLVNGTFALALPLEARSGATAFARRQRLAADAEDLHRPDLQRPGRRSTSSSASAPTTRCARAPTARRSPTR